MPSEPIEEQRGRPRWPTVVSVCGFAIIMTVVLLVPRYLASVQAAQHARCMSNLKQLHLALLVYSDDYAGTYPPMDLTNPTLVGTMQLLRKYVPSATIMFCLGDHRPGAQAEADLKKLTPVNISYSYVPNVKRTDAPDSPVLLDRIYSTTKGSRWPSNGNHRTAGGNVVFNDGHGEWCTTLPRALKMSDGQEFVLSP